MRFTYGKYGIALRDANTESGRVRGLPGNHRKFTVFKGIPYAAPPVGALRWRPPQPAAKWEGVRECFRFSATPIQFYPEVSGNLRPENGFDEESEDCLYMNIWTPAHSPEEKLPVLFWTYGGAFNGGAANAGLSTYDGEGFCKRGVIFVSYNYRPGPLGLLCHPLLSEEQGSCSGNYYFMDQIAALKWVRRNIAGFGGDPDRITVMGHSSGSVATTALACTPLTKGDMVGASIQSGVLARSFTGPGEIFVSREEGERRGAEFAALCGCATLEELRTLDITVMKDALRKTKHGMHTMTGIIDGTIFPDNPTAMYYRGENHDIAYLAGTAMDEEQNLVPLGGSSALLTRDNVPDYAKHFGDQEQAFLDLAATLREDEILAGRVNSGSMGTRQFAVNQLRHGRTPLYAFCFIRRQPGDNSGASHGAEHQYVFQTLDRSWRPYSAADYALSDLMADYWANFVKTGNPNGEGLPEWTPFTKERPLTMMMDSSPFLAERELSKIQRFTLDYFTTTDEVHSLT